MMTVINTQISENMEWIKVEDWLCFEKSNKIIIF